MTPWLSEMLTLETIHPEVYQEFKKGNFLVQLSERNSFGRCEPDRVTKTTINKDTKTPGGLTGFSTKTSVVGRWKINASQQASLYLHLLICKSSYGRIQKSMLIQIYKSQE